MRSPWLVLTFILCTAVVAACVDTPGATTAELATPITAVTARPTPRPTQRPIPTPTTKPRPTRAPATVPPGPTAIAIEGGDPASAAEVIDATQNLAGLRAYRFELSSTGRVMIELGADRYLDVGARGSLTTAPTNAFDIEAGTRMLETAFDGATGFGSQYVVIGDLGWGIQPERDPVAMKMTDETRGILSAVFLPEGIATRVVAPFADAYVRVGPERHAGVDAIHYRATKAGLKAYESTIDMQGKWSADLWVAVDGGYLLAVKIDCTPKPLPTPNPKASPGQGTSAWVHDRGFHVRLEVTDADDPAIEIEVPPSPAPSDPGPS